MRTTMTTLVGELRNMIGDTAGASAAFTDDQLERLLDHNREERVKQPVYPTENPTAGVVEQKLFYTPDKFWEGGVTFCDLQYSALTPTASDLLQGRFEFAASHSSILVSGYTYDMNGAAADACDAWAAKVKLDFDFGADGQNYTESQKYLNLRDMAKNFRSRAVFSKGLSAAGGIGLGCYESVDWEREEINHR